MLYSRSRAIYYFLWIVGLLIYLFLSHIVLDRLTEAARLSTNDDYTAMAQFACSFLLGLYVSPLFVRNWRFRPRFSILILVFLPCLILSLFSFLPLYVAMHVPAWMTTGSIELTGLSLVSGCSLVYGLYHNNEPRNRYSF